MNVEQGEAMLAISFSITSVKGQRVYEVTYEPPLESLTVLPGPTGNVVRGKLRRDRDNDFPKLLRRSLHNFDLDRRMNALHHPDQTPDNGYLTRFSRITGQPALSGPLPSEHDLFTAVIKLYARATYAEYEHNIKVNR
jgi:hypothetical protein